MSEQEITPQRQQLLANIATIIEALQRVPGVTGVDIQEPEADDMWEKKVFVIFAGCDEPVGVEMF
jgi:hypothetical protein